MKYIIVSVFLLFSPFLNGQKRVPSNGFGLSCNALVIFIPPQGGGGAFLPQVYYTRFFNDNNFLNAGVGAFIVKRRFHAPLWLTFDYLHIHNNDKKKKIRFIYGGRFDVAIGKFAYAAQEPAMGYPKEYYKRFLVELSPEAGFLFKTGKKSFLTSTLSAGIATTLSKITLPQSTVKYYGRVLIPINLRLEYHFMFSKKKRRR